MANKDTKRAGLILDVMMVKRDMKSYIENQQKDPADRVPNFTGAQVAIAAGLEELCRIIVREGIKQTTTDKSGMRTLIRGQLRQSILAHDGLKSYYIYQLMVFDKRQQYSKQVPISSKGMDETIDDVETELELSVKALNYLNYLLMTAYLDLVSTALELMNYSGKKSLNADAVISAVRIIFRTDDMLIKTINAAIRQAVKLSGEKVTEADDEEDEDVVNNEESDSYEIESESESESYSESESESESYASVESDEDDEYDEDEDRRLGEEEEPVRKGKKKKQVPKKVIQKKKAASKKASRKKQPAIIDPESSDEEEVEEMPIKKAKKGSVKKKGSRITRKGK